MPSESRNQGNFLGPLLLLKFDKGVGNKPCRIETTDRIAQRLVTAKGVHQS